MYYSNYPFITDSPYDPWCNTCGRTISMATWNENDGECDSCKEWWENNNPDEE